MTQKQCKRRENGQHLKCCQSEELASFFLIHTARPRVGGGQRGDERGEKKVKSVKTVSHISCGPKIKFPPDPFSLLPSVRRIPLFHCLPFKAVLSGKNEILSKKPKNLFQSEKQKNSVDADICQKSYKQFHLAPWSFFKPFLSQSFSFHKIYPPTCDDLGRRRPPPPPPFRFSLTNACRQGCHLGRT